MRAHSPSLSPGFYASPVPAHFRKAPQLSTPTIKERESTDTPDPKQIPTTRRVIQRGLDSVPKILQPWHQHGRSLAIPMGFTLSNPAITAINHALHHGWASSTLTNYGHALERFRAFCAAEKIPSISSYPPTSSCSAPLRHLVPASIPDQRRATTLSRFEVWAALGAIQVAEADGVSKNEPHQSAMLL
ncbi:hypothetical protein R3P38DRAFT_2772200, partial [Favolaschia claudopus]